jgi:hypothetical protein
MDDEFTTEDAEAQPPQDEAANKAAAQRRIEQQATWVDLQIRQAMARGDFDDLPGAGKPIEGLGGEHDPDWWLKRLVEREKIAVLPASIQLRKEDAELDGVLDALATEADVRREVEAFNERVIRARYRPAEGPPLITQPRDVDAEVERWRARQRAVREARRQGQGPAAPPPKRPRRRWFLR